MRSGSARKHRETHSGEPRTGSSVQRISPVAATLSGLTYDAADLEHSAPGASIMRTAPGGRRSQRVAYNASSLFAARGAVSSYIFGVGLGLVACIIPALIINFESRVPRGEGSIQVESPSPGL